STGREIIPIEYEKPEGFVNASDFIIDDNIMLFRESSDVNYLLKGLATKNGKVIAQPKYEVMWKDENGPRFLVRKDGKFGVLAADGNWIVPAIYDDVHANNINRYTGIVSLSFPLLCYDGKSWKYVTQSGKLLPISADNIGQPAP
ncbi:MAG TPA: WG repeat-containing protein, partial [Niastella sp.]